MSSDEPWFVSGFRAGYLELYRHRDLASARAEIAGLCELLGLQPSPAQPVLDLCCGFGRHTLALKERGFTVLGLDLSEDLLRHAQTETELAPVRECLVRADARALPLQNERFGTLLNLFSSFGYFDDGGDRAVLGEMARVLRPGGELVLDLMNPSRIRSGLVPRSEALRAGGLLIEQRSLSPDGRQVFKEVEHRLPGGPVRWREAVRMYEPEELDALLDAAGFGSIRRYGDFSGATFSSTAPRQLVSARRR